MPISTPSGTPALELRGISRRFGALVALDDVSFSVRRSSIHALLGENGAGKTTLMRIAFGLLRPDTGSVVVDGRLKRMSSPADAIASGIGMVHQQFSLVPAMSVAENVALGGHGRFRKSSTAERIAEIGKRTGLVLDPEARVASLRSAERQKLEIVRTLAHDAHILILDEPTAVLTPKDIGELFGQLRSFADAGGSVVLITHRLDDALAHSDEVTVLRRGRTVLSAPTSESTLKSLATAMLGAPPATVEVVRKQRTADRTIVASLREVTVDDSPTDTGKPLSLEVLSGEVLGVAALEGAAAVLLRMLAGRITPARGVADIPGHVAFVPENRSEEALIPEFTLTENFTLRHLDDQKVLVDWDWMRRQATAVIEGFEVSATSSESAARNLSGGNQQRFVLGRELEGEPGLLVLENPTQGLDVRAAAAIRLRVREAAMRGTAVVFYSSDLDELVDISDRILVVRRSGVAFTEPSREAVGRLLLEVDTIDADVVRPGTVASGSPSGKHD